MVIPFAKQGEDIRTLLENDINKRIALTKIKEAFDLRGFTTVDFLNKLKATNMSSVFNAASQSDIKSTIISQSGADIYVSAEINYQSSSGGNSINLVISANEVSTGNSLANGVGFSGKYFTDDVAKLTVKAIDKLPDVSGFYFCIVQAKNSESYSHTTLRFGDVTEEGNDEDLNFHANCDCIVEKDRIEWLEEIDEN